MLKLVLIDLAMVVLSSGYATMNCVDADPHCKVLASREGQCDTVYTKVHCVVTCGVCDPSWSQAKLREVYEADRQHNLDILDALKAEGQSECENVCNRRCNVLKLKNTCTAENTELSIEVFRNGGFPDYSAGLHCDSGPFPLADCPCARPYSAYGPSGGLLAGVTSAELHDDAHGGQEETKEAFAEAKRVRTQALGRLTKRLAMELVMTCGGRHAYTSMLAPPDWVNVHECDEDEVFMFDGSGDPIFTVAQLIPGQRVYLLERNEQWMWPFVSMGHLQPVKLSPTGRTVHMESLSDRPRVMRVRDFLLEEETSFLIQTANVSMFDSLTNGNGRSDIRTSKQAWLAQSNVGNEEHRMVGINQKVMSLARFPWREGVNLEDHVELTDATQVVHYKKGAMYQGHHDFFEPLNHPATVDGRNRVATVLYYLNGVPEGEGGTTAFPVGGFLSHAALTDESLDLHASRALRMPVQDQCRNGLQVTPEEGAAVIFYSMLPWGEMDKLSLHTGCPPIMDGTEKWLANKWLWNKESQRGAPAWRLPQLGNFHPFYSHTDALTEVPAQN